MRTRRSPRNQDRLFRALFAPAPTAPRPPPRIRTDEEIDALPWSKPAKAAEKRAAANARMRAALKPR